MKIRIVLQQQGCFLHQTYIIHQIESVSDGQYLPRFLPVSPQNYTWLSLPTSPPSTHVFVEREMFDNFISPFIAFQMPATWR